MEYTKRGMEIGSKDETLRQLLFTKRKKSIATIDGTDATQTTTKLEKQDVEEDGTSMRCFMVHSVQVKQQRDY